MTVPSARSTEIVRVGLLVQTGTEKSISSRIPLMSVGSVKLFTVSAAPKASACVGNWMIPCKWPYHMGHLCFRKSQVAGRKKTALALSRLATCALALCEERILPHVAEIRLAGDDVELLRRLVHILVFRVLAPGRDPEAVLEIVGVATAAHVEGSRDLEPGPRRGVVQEPHPLAGVYLPDPGRGEVRPRLRLLGGRGDRAGDDDPLQTEDRGEEIRREDPLLGVLDLGEDRGFLGQGHVGPDVEEEPVREETGVALDRRHLGLDVCQEGITRPRAPG